MTYNFQSEYVEWAEFLTWWKWKQGEHVTAIGPTGTGKTTLLTSILPRRDYVLFLATKKVDSTVNRLAKQGYRIVSDYREIRPEMDKKVILKPPFPNMKALEMKKLHQEVFGDALAWVFRTGGWCVVADEVRYVTEFLRLEPEMELLWLQGRSLGITIASATQRPRAIPLTAYDQATHLFFWRDSDRQNQQRIAEISGVDIDPREIMREVANLPPHEVLYVNTRTGQGLRTKVEV